MLRNTYFLTTFGHLQASGQICGTSSLINLIFVIAVFETKNQWKLPMLGEPSLHLSEALWRLWEPPWLIAEPPKHQVKPLLSTASIHGTMASLHGSIVSLHSAMGSLLAPWWASMVPWWSSIVPRWYCYRIRRGAWGRIIPPVTVSEMTIHNTSAYLSTDIGDTE